MEKIKNILRRILKPLIFWLGFVERPTVLDEEIKGLKRKAIGIYNSLNHDPNANIHMVWRPIIPVKRQLDLSAKFQIIYNREDTKNVETLSERMAISFQDTINSIVQTDTEVLWLIQYVHYMQGLDAAAKQQQDNEHFSKLMDLLADLRKRI